MHAAVAVLVILALGCSSLAVWGMQASLWMGESGEEARRNLADPAVRRRMWLALAGLTAFILFEAAIFLAGAASGHTALGASVAVAVVVVALPVGLVLAIRSDRRNGFLP